MNGSDETRIVLLGKTGSGKSSLGNTILADSLLKVKLSPTSETNECQAESKHVNGKLIKVIDTPGFFDTKMDEDKLKPEIIKSVKECSPGVHAFVIMLEVGRYTQQEKDVISKILKYFSEEALKHAVVVFTHGDQLNKGQTIEKFYDQNPDLRDLVKKCGGRCHVVDNKYWNNDQHDEYRSNRFQVTQLLNTVEKMKNNQGLYTNELLQEAGKMSLCKLLKILAGALVGALLGALFGGGIGLTIGGKIGACIGAGAAGVTGAVVGAAIGYNSETAQEAVEKTAKTVYDVGMTAVKALKSVSEEKPKPVDVDGLNNKMIQQ